MKRTLPFLLALLLNLNFTVPATNAAGTARENKRLQEGKITKNQAEHLVLTKFPGAKVKKCVLSGGHDHGIWMLDVLKPGESKVSKIQVDGRTGKFLP